MSATPKDKQVEAYAAARPIFNDYCNRLELLLSDLLSDHKFHLIESRAKSISSFSDKLSRPDKSYDNPLTEITDLAGIRIIAYYTDDAISISELIDREFTVDQDNSLNHIDQLDPDQFGYISIHKIITLSKSRSNLAEWSSYKDLRAEIQIRTVLQHAWSVISHALQYKSEISVPSQSRRKLNRLAGILELADEEFVELRDEKTNIKIDTLRSFEDNNFDKEINIVTTTELVYDLKDSLDLSFFSQNEEYWVSGTSDPARDDLSLVSELLGYSTIQTLRSDIIAHASDFSELMTTLKLELDKRDIEVAGTLGNLNHWLSVFVVAINHDYFWPIKNRPDFWDPDYSKRVVLAGRRFFGQ